jgi:type I restriction enzyme S subunit
MHDGWDKVQLDDVVSFLSGGTPKKAEDSFWGGDIPWISGATLTDRRLDSSDRRLTLVGVENGSRIAPAGATLILVRGMSLLKEIRIGQAIRDLAFNQDVKALVPAPRVDAWFLTYALLARRPELLRMVHQAGHGTGVLATDLLRSLSITLPPLEEQRRIAGVLGALDDLIDTDRDLVDTLVEQADSIAADFRAGGDATTFGEVCDVFGGATPKTSEPSYWNGDRPWATPSDITALRSPYLFATSREITQAGLDACSSDLHPPGSILMTSRATIGAFALAQISTATNQGFIVVEPRREEDRYFLLHEMRQRVPEFMDHANGSTFMEISRGTFKSLSVEWPSASDRRDLTNKLEPLHRAAIELEREIAELESRRHEVLPLLLTGRVRIEDMAA